MDIDQNIRNNLVALRKSCGETQAYLSRKVGVERQTITKWECTQWPNSRHLSVDHLVKIAEHYGVTLDELVTTDLRPRLKANTQVLAKSIQVTNMQTSQNPDTRPVKTEEEKFMNTTTERIPTEIAFPRMDPSTYKGNELFDKAFQLETGMDDHDGECAIKVIDLYWEAFVEYGIPEAGINVLRMLFRLESSMKEHGAENRYTFQNKIDAILDRLVSIDHPVGLYYHAFGLMYSLIKTDMTEDEARESGLMEMYELSDMRNEYATAFLKANDLL